MADHTLFVCSERGNPCLFWQWAHVFEGIKPLCKYGLTCRTNKVTKEGPIIKIAYSTVVPTKEKELKKPTKNSYIKISVDELVEGITKLNIC